MKRSVQIAVFCGCFLVGVLIAANFGIKYALPVVAVAAAVFVVTCMSAKKLVVFALIPLALMLGANYLHFWNARNAENTIGHYIGQKVEVRGRVIGTSYWNEYGEFVSTLTDVKINGHNVRGTLRVSSLLSNANEGFVISTEGKLYKTLSKADAQIIYAKTRVVSTKRPWLVGVKTSFERGVQNALPSPAAQFVEGIVIGDRSSLPKPIQDDLTRLGLSHIIAVSGYNLTILIFIIAKFLRLKWKWLNLALCLWLILGFVMLTGASASILRAGVMSALFLVCRYYGKKLSIGTAVMLTALVTVLMNPNYIISDLSWQLSFAALLGIILLTPAFTKILPKKPAMLSEIIEVSLAAQVFTIPLIAFKFGTLSIVAPLANLILMPFVPFLMGAGIIAGTVGIFLPTLSGYIFLPFALILKNILSIIHASAKKPYASINIITPSIAQITLYYLVIALGVLAGLRNSRAISYNGVKESL